jgi:hypothetical protein
VQHTATRADTVWTVWWSSQVATPTCTRVNSQVRISWQVHVIVVQYLSCTAMRSEDNRRLTEPGAPAATPGANSITGHCMQHAAPPQQCRTVMHGLCSGSKGMQAVHVQRRPRGTCPDGQQVSISSSCHYRNICLTSAAGTLLLLRAASSYLPAAALQPLAGKHHSAWGSWLRQDSATGIGSTWYYISTALPSRPRQDSSGSQQQHLSPACCYCFFSLSFFGLASYILSLVYSPKPTMDTR